MKAASSAAPSPPRPSEPIPLNQPRTQATVVIPCYNETQSLPYLRNALQTVTARYQDALEFSFVFVDDCSTDGTWEMLHALFGSNPSCRFARHQRNRGIAAAIQTGIEQAHTEVVCSIDCDCTYDPQELGAMIPLLTDGVDLITASPYHSQGGVRNVRAWRLSLSKSASALYRLVLRQKLYTYTSCFRVYRRSAALDIKLREPGYVGLVELIGKLDLQGRRVVEYPTTLEVRLMGYSKMKIVRNILGHLSLLTRLAFLRLIGGQVEPAHTHSRSVFQPGTFLSGAQKRVRQGLRHWSQ
jgi:glycosyltransferase involved in cell wall biosynthesis